MIRFTIVLKEFPEEKGFRLVCTTDSNEPTDLELQIGVPLAEVLGKLLESTGSEEFLEAVGIDGKIQTIQGAEANKEQIEAFIAEHGKVDYE